MVIKGDVDEEEKNTVQYNLNKTLLAYLEEYYNNNTFRNEVNPPENFEKVNPLEIFGSIYAALRRKRKFTLREVSSRSGIPVAELAAIELGRADVKIIVDRIEELSQGVDVDPALLNDQLEKFTSTPVAL